MTHGERLLKYLKTHKRGITSKEAFEKLGNTRISSTVNYLRNKGYDIQMEYITVPTRFGTKTKVGRYTLNA